jgi:mRNA interferase RelE/StbE
MPRNSATLIEAKINQYAEDPLSLSNNVIALKGFNDLYRLRVGDWRVVFTDKGEILQIEKIGSRGDIYD